MQFYFVNPSLNCHTESDLKQSKGGNLNVESKYIQPVVTAVSEVKTQRKEDVHNKPMHTPLPSTQSSLQQLSSDMHIIVQQPNTAVNNSEDAKKAVPVCVQQAAVSNSPETINESPITIPPATITAVATCTTPIAVCKEGCKPVISDGAATTADLGIQNKKNVSGIESSQDLKAAPESNVPLDSADDSSVSINKATLPPASKPIITQSSVPDQIQKSDVPPVGK